MLLCLIHFKTFFYFSLLIHVSFSSIFYFFVCKITHATQGARCFFIVISLLTKKREPKVSSILLVILYSYKTRYISLFCYIKQLLTIFFTFFVLEIDRTCCHK